MSFNEKDSVQLGTRTKAKIELQIRKLREIIASSTDISVSKKKSLLEKLDELSLELVKTRLNFGKTMAIIAYVSTAIAIGTSFLADAPQALVTITSLIGHDKELEEQEQKRLGTQPEQKALPAPEPGACTKPVEFDLDDEIPF